jgi:hypothetical protein
MLPSSDMGRTDLDVTPPHVFNDDLLINNRKPPDDNRDLAHAQSEYPEIIHVLDYPRLKETFVAFEKEANRARDRVRVLGFTAVVSAALALLAIAAKPVLPSAPWTRWLALVIELGGMFAALIAAGGFWLGPWKRRWLESRLMTERLRQWHFQMMVRRGQQIEASAHGPKAVAHFSQERDRWFEEFLRNHKGKLDTQLELLTNETAHLEAWLHSPATAYRNENGILTHLFRAYEELRFDHQYKYAVYKLRRSTDKPVWHFLQWPAIRQSAVLSGLSSACFTIALICSAALVYDDTFGFSQDLELYIRTGAIVVALIGAALRTIQEGLAVEQEIERYNDYRGRTFQLRDRFTRSTDMKERIQLMTELELASVDELIGFLRTHRNASFVLQ